VPASPPRERAQARPDDGQFDDDGRRCLGFILARGKLGFEAMDRDEQSLGLFRWQRAASDAITQAVAAECEW
jgi:hypothetical protein